MSVEPEDAARQIDHGLTFRAWRGGDYVSLAEVLRVLSVHVADLEWALKIDEVAPGPGASLIESIEPGQRIRTPELLQLMTPDMQIIDGELSGYREGGRLVLRIRAVDSSDWDLESNDERILDTVAAAYECRPAA